jgi:hypothetical protein
MLTSLGFRQQYQYAPGRVGITIIVAINDGRQIIVKKAVRRHLHPVWPHHSQ